MKRFRMFLAKSILFYVLAMATQHVTAQTDTTFTYQAELKQNGQPVNGQFNLDFALFDAAVGGNQIGSEITFNSFLIDDGRFTVDLDFGGGIFDGNPRFLEVSINGSELVPRQRVNGAPYSIQTRGLFVDEFNNVGVGTTSPSAPLHVIGEVRATRPGDELQSVTIQSNTAAGAFVQGNSRINNQKLLTVASLFQNDGNPPAGETGIRFQVGSDIAPVEAMRITQSGNVGIGTATPTLAPLQIEANGNRALFAHNTGTTGFGDAIVAQTEDSGGSVAIVGINFDGGTAGVFQGDVDVIGDLSKSSGSFKIDHPLDPANKFLYHSFVESPDMMNIYNGNVVTDSKGYATIEMPDWFEALNRDFRYQLTVIDEGDANDFVLVKVVEEIQVNQFRIRTSAPSTKVSWQVTGVRQDAWAQAHRIPVEEDKVDHEIGHYLHPEVFGLDREMSIASARERLIEEESQPEPSTSEGN